MQGTKVNTGGPAFPLQTDRFPDGELLGERNEGMTMRDYFAAKVVHASITTDIDHSLLPIDHARWAYDVADAMIEVRSI